MKFYRREQSKKSLLVSIAIHIVAIAGLAAVTFHYPLASVLRMQRTEPLKPERIQFVRLPSGPAPALGNGSNPKAPPPKGAPAPLRAPREVPRGIPPVPPDDQSGGAVSGRVGGKGGAPAGMATGVEPAMPDPRIALEPGTLSPVPKTQAQRVDSTVRSIFRTYADSVAVADANKGRAPTDWTVTKGGQKWGMDPSLIYLGKVKIPTTLLALLPLKVGANQSPIEARSNAWMRRDIMDNAQRSISEDEFRAAVKRVRERKQKEREGQVVAEKRAPGGEGPVGAMPEHGARPQ